MLRGLLLFLLLLLLLLLTATSPSGRHFLLLFFLFGFVFVCSTVRKVKHIDTQKKKERVTFFIPF